MILLDNVTKYYPHETKPVLDNITVHIQPKEFVFLVGASGAGKSSLIKMLTREEKPNSGKIMVGGIDYDYLKKRHIPHLRRRLGVVFQDLKLLRTTPACRYCTLNGAPAQDSHRRRADRQP